MLAAVTDFLWTYVLVAVLITIGVIFTVASRFVQIRYFFEMFRVLGQAFKHHPGHVSSFQALTLSVAGRVGAGNVAGVAVAITLGGPGAVFWMWVVGLIGMATSFFECSLAQAFKVAEFKTSTYRGGPAYYMERGLGSRKLGMIFTLLLLFTFGLAFVALQSFTASSSLEEAFDVPMHITGIVMTIVVGLTIFGGVQRISRVTEIIVPVMAVAYVIVALAVVGINYAEVPGVLALIVKSAFGLEEAIGGGIGAAIMMGVRRGLFSNEAGLGSAPNVAAVAFVPHPVNQGIVQSFSVFIDTAIICTATAFIILISGIHETSAVDDGVVLTQLALQDHVGPWGQTFVSVILTLFAFSSILYNFYLGENSSSWMTPDNPIFFIVFRLLMLVLILWGSMQDLTTVFSFADLTMALLAVFNLVALALLMKVGFRLMNDYDRQWRAGKVPVFDPDDFPDLNIDREAWKDAADAVDRVRK
ncbi:MULTISPECIES: sodium:alanine symporter family protein [unclassified Wenzhouxiangella]|uniref:alanine/glycine:cation symporter family protein n=1 Tax=unclassified Wenzhouxiangella TaxID=2613841 RepID=UPI000E32BC72|nr:MULTISPECIES: alanine/glycine:cation symporter family protein [unclassified Wenzhouxiangella]RFF28519.1 alanine:cation symporter family protein [Wenzhouxiangella sp. 15181]RFP70037.1 alanine:cation symporter family protein [Wenzhouxiangella sp. 15190]